MSKSRIILYLAVILFFAVQADLAYADNLPQITSISPTQATVGDPDFYLTVHGNKFHQNNSIVHIVNFPLTEDYQPPVTGSQSSHQISVLVSVTPPGGIPWQDYLVIVENNPPSGETSNAVPFTVLNAPPYTNNLAVSSQPCPVALDTGLALFSWNYQDLDGDAESKFQLQIVNSATNPNFDVALPFAINQTVSGLSNPADSPNQQSVYIVVGGDEQDSLRYNKTYYWRVKVWQEDPLNPSNPGLESAWNQTSYITINHPGPYANFSYTLTSPAVNFTDTSICYDSDNTCNTYLYDFGDSLTATFKNTAHSYRNPGNYTVYLSVTDGDGLQCATNQNVTAPNPIPLNSLPTWKETSAYDFSDQACIPDGQACAGSQPCCSGMCTSTWNPPNPPTAVCGPGAQGGRIK